MNKWFKSINAALLGCSLLVPFSLPVSAQNINNIKVTNQFTLNDGEPGTRLPVGATVHYLSNGAAKIFDEKNMLLFTTSDTDALSVITPGGRKKADHVFGVPNATMISRVGNI